MKLSKPILILLAVLVVVAGIPLLANNEGAVGVTKLSFGSGSLAVVSEDIRKPVLIGFPWSDNRPDNTIFPFSISTGRVKSYPDSRRRVS